MLRIIVISLVVANLLLLAFQGSNPVIEQDEARPAVAAVEDSRIPTIHLFSEMMQDQDLLSGNRQCFTLGPFHSIEDRDDVQARLLAVSTRIAERQTEALVEKGYWVYMPPYASLLEANEALLSLQALGLKDVAIIYDGEWKNSISLGYFMRQENAQRRKKALEERGFRPTMRIQRQAEPRYWLDYEQEPGAGLIALDMQNRPNDFMQRPVPCPEADFLEAETVASADSTGKPAEAQTKIEDSLVAAGETATDRPDANGQETRAADQAVDNAVSTKPENSSGGDTAKAAETTPGGEPAEAVAEKAVEPDHQTSAPAGATGSADKPAVAAVPDDVPATVEDSGEDSGVEKAAAAKQEPAGASDDGTTAQDKAPPKQAVGTGPVDTISVEQAPPEGNGDDGDAENPDDGTTGDKPEDGAAKPADDVEQDTPAAAPGDSAEQSGPAETEKDAGNGTGVGR